MGYFLKNFLEIMALNFLGQPAPGSYWIFIAFYSLNLTQKDVYPSAGLINMASSMNAIEEMYHLSRAMSLIALVAIVPVIGYYRIYENIISTLLFWNLHHYYIYIYNH
jgi:PHS family inorganic phosphate transporter-like MFS transporter